MFFGYDRTGFPLIPVFEAGIEAHLLPVTKIQFEDFLQETGRSDDAEYKEMLELNPNVSHLKFTPDNREQLFITGVLPEEVTALTTCCSSYQRVDPGTENLP